MSLHDLLLVAGALYVALVATYLIHAVVAPSRPAGVAPRSRPARRP